MADRDLLDDYFEAARATPLTPTPELLERVAADAADWQTTPPAARGSGLGTGLSGVLAALGGWRGGLGLATVAMTGVFIGYLGPVSLSDLSDPVAALYFDVSDLGAGYGGDVLGAGIGL